MDLDVTTVTKALAEWDSLDMDEGLYPESVLVKAVRMWLNPNLEAAAATYERQYQNGLIDVGDIVAAAHTTPGDTE